MILGISKYLLLSRIVKGIHFIIALTNTIAMVVLVIYAPWYIWCPVNTILVATTTKQDYSCILTRIENKLRAKDGLPPLKSFLEDIYRKV